MSFYYVQKPFEKFGKNLINSVEIQIDKGEHVAMIGNNGIGKTTLLEAIKMKYQDEAYLMHQNMSVYEHLTGLDYVMAINPELLQIKQKLKSNYKYIADYSALNGYEFEQNIITQANQLNLTERDLEKQIQYLSGGQQMRLALLKAFMSNKPLILLDEPTNHLDLEMLEQLIKKIQKSKYTIIFVSHQRDFIDQTATHVIEVTSEKTNKYNGNYSKYRKIKDLTLQTQQNMYEKQQKEIAELNRTIQRIQTWHHSAQQKASVRSPLEQKKLSKLAQRAKTKEKQMTQKLNEKTINQPDNEQKHYHFNHQDRLRKRFLIHFEDFNVAINEHHIFEHAHFEMKQKENILITGPNGSGKSLLIAMIRQKILPNQGNIKITPSLKIGYFDQTNKNLNEAESPLSMLLTTNKILRSEAQTILASFGFNEEKINAPISQLSMGEKSRFQFVLLYFSGANLLILDEPTNYFDISTQDLILNMIKSFNGQVLVVTHDEYFQSRFKATHWEIKDKKLYNLTLNNTTKSNVDETLALLDEYEMIDENGHFETDN
ncbi:Sal family ABC-F type ribosomal protection protein [Staphylococcus cohnii]|uniref:Sal family ABC-F type ribosomal protection protein n=1 Tax=Staphylococcus cohnii TaxID=29382 RepID=UPI0018673EFB|nr:Sal family ABC-F type ribosomal protection protein [Staphylococcus cohnii]